MPFVVIVGRPNTGKSTLFNRIAGSKKALVDDLPGVTRDLHYADVRLFDREFTLADTGGLSLEAPDELIGMVAAQVEFAMDEADAIVFLMDGRDGLTPEDEEIAARLRKTKKKVFCVVNKVEGATVENAAVDFYRLGFDKLHLISARENIGVKDLFKEILADFPPSEERSGETNADGNARPTRVAVVGKPNVGKSSLINRLLGARRMIVSETPGTTRDAIDIPFTYRKKNYLLIDTAGIRRKAKVTYRIEKFAVVKALEAMHRCHVAVVMGDAEEYFTDQTLRVTSYALDHGRAVIWLFNKFDLVSDEKAWKREIDRQIDLRLRHLEFIPILPASAKTGRGIGKIFPMVERVSAAHNRRIETGPLNRLIEKAVAAHSPPILKNNPLKFYYVTQTAVRPPTFVFFTNAPEAVHFSYRRFLTNTIREFGDFAGTPLRLLFKKSPKSGRFRK